MEEWDGIMVAELDWRTEDVCPYMFYKCSYILIVASADIAENNGALFLRQSGF